MRKKEPNFERLRSEGDLNISSRRAGWQKDRLDKETRRWLAQDAEFFLH